MESDVYEEYFRKQCEGAIQKKIDRNIKMMDLLILSKTFNKPIEEIILLLNIS
jgi:hypothetical protein